MYPTEPCAPWKKGQCAPFSSDDMYFSKEHQTSFFPGDFQALGSRQGWWFVLIKVQSGGVLSNQVMGKESAQPLAGTTCTVEDQALQQWIEMYEFLGLCFSLLHPPYFYFSTRGVAAWGPALQNIQTNHPNSLTLVTFPISTNPQFLTSIKLQQLSLWKWTEASWTSKQVWIDQSQLRISGQAHWTQKFRTLRLSPSFLSCQWQLDY